MTQPSSSGSLAVALARLDEILGRRPAVGLAVGVVRQGRLEAFHSHGVADIESGRPITEDTVFRIASITKTITAVSVLQLWERGVIDLDAPANDYLTSFRLVDTEAGYGAATVRHLLTHTAGLAEVAHPSGVMRPDFGESVPAGSRIPTPAEFYRGALRIHAEPGTRFLYNNHGPTTLGQIVEDVTRMPLRDYVHRHVFVPLGMTDSDLARTTRLEERRATGYEIRRGGIEAVEERDMVTTGAASAFSTVRDMARYVSALVSDGTDVHGSVLRRETVATMFAPHHRPDPRLAGMGLGFFRSRHRGRVFVGHQGTHPGFHSQMTLDPDSGIGLIAFTNGARQPDFWLPAAVSELLAILAGLPDDPPPTFAPARPDLWPGLCGWYRLSAGLTDVRLRGMLGFGAEVFVRNGRLMLRFLTPVPALAGGMPLDAADPTDPSVFRIDLGSEGMEPMTVVFGQDGSGLTDRLHLDVMPLTLDKGTSRTNPRRIAAGVGTAVGLWALSRRIGSTARHRGASTGRGERT